MRHITQRMREYTYIYIYIYITGRLFFQDTLFVASSTETKCNSLCLVHLGLSLYYLLFFIQCERALCSSFTRCSDCKRTMREHVYVLDYAERYSFFLTAFLKRRLSIVCHSAPFVSQSIRVQSRELIVRLLLLLRKSKKKTSSCMARDFVSVSAGRRSVGGRKASQRASDPTAFLFFTTSKVQRRISSSSSPKRRRKILAVHKRPLVYSERQKR